MPLWNPYNYYNWGGASVMWAGFPVQANSSTTCAGSNAGCTEVANVEGPSSTAILIPGYFITYNRPAPAIDATSVFGAACTTGYTSSTVEPPVLARKTIHAFADGANYGMADSSAKWMPTKRFNKDNSRIFAFGGTNYQASPFMFVK
jgi:hypothetical protein